MELSKNYISVYYIGLNDKDTHKQKYNFNTYLKLLNSILLGDDVTSYTITKATGFYKGEKENTIRLELLNDCLTQKAIDNIKEVFNQECIMDITFALYKSELGLFR